MEYLQVMCRILPSLRVSAFNSKKTESASGKKRMINIDKLSSTPCLAKANSIRSYKLKV